MNKMCLMTTLCSRIVYWGSIVRWHGLHYLGKCSVNPQHVLSILVAEEFIFLSVVCCFYDEFRSIR